MRTETRIGAGRRRCRRWPSSWPRRCSTTCPGCSVLVIGAGRMAEATALALVRHGVREVVVANRTVGTARELAARFGGRGVGFDRLGAGARGGRHRHLLHRRAPRHPAPRRPGAGGDRARRPPHGDRGHRGAARRGGVGGRAGGRLPVRHRRPRAGRGGQPQRPAPGGRARRGLRRWARSRASPPGGAAWPPAPAISSLRARAEEIRRAELGRLEGQWEDLSRRRPRAPRGPHQGHRQQAPARAHGPRCGRRPATGTTSGTWRACATSSASRLPPAPDRLRRGDAVRLILATRRSPLALAQTELVAAALARRRARDRAAAAHHHRRPLERRGHRRGPRQGPLREGAGGGAARRAAPTWPSTRPRTCRPSCPTAWPCSRCRRARIPATCWWARRAASPRCRRAPAWPPGARAAPPRSWRRAPTSSSCRSGATWGPGSTSSRAGDADALVLAAAGLRRLGLSPEGAEPLSVELSTPAPGQGLLAVEGRDGDAAVARAVSALDDADRPRLPARRARVPLGRGRGLPGAGGRPAARPWRGACA